MLHCVFQALSTCRTLPQLDRMIQRQGLDQNDPAVKLRRADLKVS